MEPISTDCFLTSTSITDKDVLAPNGTYTHYVSVEPVETAEGKKQYSYSVQVKFVFRDINQEYGEISGICKQVYEELPHWSVLTKSFDTATANVLNLLRTEASPHLNLHNTLYVPPKSEQVRAFVGRALEKLQGFQPNQGD